MKSSLPRCPMTPGTSASGKLNRFDMKMNGSNGGRNSRFSSVETVATSGGNRFGFRHPSDRGYCRLVVGTFGEDWIRSIVHFFVSATFWRQMSPQPATRRSRGLHRIAPSPGKVPQSPFYKIDFRKLTLFQLLRTRLTWISAARPNSRNVYAHV